MSIPRALFWAALNTLSDLGIALAWVASSPRSYRSPWLVHLLRDYFVHLTPDEHGNVEVERAREKFSNGYVRIISP